ncbi:MAG: hypothetical protein ACRER3_04830 [Pseudomonas fluorescens]
MDTSLFRRGLIGLATLIVYMPSFATAMSCVLQQDGDARVLTSDGKEVDIPEGPFGVPFANCLGLKVAEGEVTLITMTAEHTRSSNRFEAGQTVTPESLAAQGGESSFWGLGILAEILSGTATESQGVSRGAKASAVAFQQYLNGKILKHSSMTQYDLRPLGASMVSDLSFVTKNAQRLSAHGATLQQGILTVAPDTFEFGRTYLWKAKIDGVDVSGETQVADENTEPDLREEVEKALSTTRPPNELLALATRLWEKRFALESLAVAQRWLAPSGR